MKLTHCCSPGQRHQIYFLCLSPRYSENKKHWLSITNSECVSCSVLSDSLWPHGLWPARLLCPRDSPGKNTGVVCHSLLQRSCWPRDRTHLSCTAGRFFTSWATREALQVLRTLCMEAQGLYVWRSTFVTPRSYLMLHSVHHSSVY